CRTCHREKTGRFEEVASLHASVLTVGGMDYSAAVCGLHAAINKQPVNHKTRKATGLGIL
ncbi:MAG TPA: hypothetical protein VNO52_17670, partial [Methylomirabilota bacterium]|nr:hypothetical protein [Methylomirabilota bacterium]